MAFDADGYRKAARRAGIPTDVINQSIAERTGAKGWITGGKEGIGAIGNAIGEFLNIPSYAVGGMLDRLKNKGAESLNPVKNPFGISAAIEGIREKKPVMQELPETFGIDPNSTGGLAMGFAGELATPDPVSMFSGAYKLLKGADKAGDLGMAARGTKKLGSEIADKGSMLPLRGLGRNNTTKRLVNQLDRLGMSSDEFMDTFNLWDRSVDDANDVLKAVDKAYKKAAYQSGKSVNTADVVRALDDEIAKLVPTAQQSRSARAQLERMVEAKEGLLKSIQNNSGGAVSTPLKTDVGNIARAKSFVSEDIPQSYFNAGAAQTGAGRGAERARRVYKNIVDTATGGETARLGGQESALINYRDLLKSRELADKGNMNFSPLKWIAPGAGGALGGIPGAIAGAGAQAAMNSPKGIATQSKLYRGVGEALQNPQTLQNIDRATDFAGRTARTGFRVSQQPSGQTGNDRSLLQEDQPGIPETDSRSRVSYSNYYKPQNKKVNLFSRRSY